MSTPLIVVVAILGYTAFFGPWIAGAVMAKRAYGRWKWPEARLAFLAFAAVPVAIVINFLVPSGIGLLVNQGWLDEELLAGNYLRYWFTFTTAVTAAATVLIAVAMYRLAARSARNRAG